jgi:hypothetical protein
MSYGCPSLETGFRLGYPRTRSMPGSKTRFGFSGTDEPVPLEGKAPDAPRAARTVLGHETHRPGQAGASSPASNPSPGIESQGARPTPEPRSGVPEAVVHEEITERVGTRRGHTGKSKFPAIARLLGRWTTEGRFLSRSRILADETMPEVPRNVWPSRIAIFLGAALLSFLIAMAVMKAGHLE